MSRLPGPDVSSCTIRRLPGCPQELFPRAPSFVAPTQRRHCGLSRFRGLRKQAPALAKAHFPVGTHLESSNPTPLRCAHLDSINRSPREETPKERLSQSWSTGQTRERERERWGGGAGLKGSFLFQPHEDLPGTIFGAECSAAE